MSGAGRGTAGSGRPGRFRTLIHGFDGLLGDTLWSGFHDALMLIQALTSFTLLQWSLDSIAYGQYTAAWGLISPVSAITSGVGLALLQRMIGERDDPDASLRSFLSLMLAATSIGAVVMLSIAAVTIDLSVPTLAIMVVGELIVIGAITLGSFLVQAVSGFPAAARVRLAVIVVRFVVVVGLYATGRLTIPNLVAGHLVGFAFFTGYLVVVHLPRHGYRVRLGRPSGIALTSTGTFAVPMAASKFQTDSDNYFIAAFGHDADAGIYAAAYRILLLGIAPLSALDAAAFQRFLPRGEDEPGLHWRRATRLGGLMVTASVVLALAIFLALPLVEGILLQDGFEDAAEIIPWLLLLIPVIATTNGPMNGLLGLGRADVRMRVYLLGAAVALVGYLILIPPFSWRGAVAATFISETFLSILAWSSLWVHQRRADQAIGRAAYLPSGHPSS